MPNPTSKKQEFRELLERLNKPPKEDFAIGRCTECENVVWIDLSQRVSGMAESCEEHEPLCYFN